MAIDPASFCSLWGLASVLALGASGCIVVDHRGSTHGSGVCANCGSFSQPTEYIDTDAVVDTSGGPGSGVAVLLEYFSGGYWHVRTSCDYLVPASPQVPCAYQVDARALNSMPSNAYGETLGATDSVSYEGSDSVVLIAQTSTQYSGMWFQTSPGDSVEFISYLDGALESRGGFILSEGTQPQSRRVNPITLVPTTP